MARSVLHRPQLDVDEFQGIITASPQMREFFALLQRVGRTDATILIRGETGTGKELVARALHRVSRRSQGPLKAINCATLTPDLLASELFGHVRGAFTGAVGDRRGLFALADGGTIFLDEVAEISPEIQARLLRVLQERTFVPVGATEPVSADVRVISATNKALRQEVAAGRFREDLMYRIRVVPLFLPPLRDRDDDVLALTWHFIDEFNGRGLRLVDAIAKDAMETMCAYPWPGNIRELRNVIEHAYAIGEGNVLRCEDLTPELRGDAVALADAPIGGEGGGEQRALPAHARVERERIRAALEEAGGRKGDAAEALGMSRTTLWRKLREYGLAGYR